MPDTTAQKEEKEVKKIAAELKVNLPTKRMPILIKLIVLFLLAGGFSIIGSLFTNIINTDPIDLWSYILRVVFGFLIITMAYGIIEKKSWALWLYALLALIGLATNPIPVILPIIILIYLFSKREYFTSCILDKTCKAIWDRIISLLPRKTKAS
ncbi:hypothetical protein KGO95_00520 [Patescibacteria group bacterium]|nr:hypothetical protein [Patescibacteria group bacterium]